MTREVAITLILGVGWPFLVLGSIYTIFQLYKSHKKYKSETTKIIITLIVGWFITMYSLGIVSTFYLLSNAENALLIVGFVFAVWIITMLMVISTAYKTRKHIIFGYEHEINKRAKSFEENKKLLESEVEKRTLELKRKAEELEKINEVMVGRELKMDELKKEIQNLKKTANNN